MSEEQSESKAKPAVKKSVSKKVAIILIRGVTKTDSKIKAALHMLRLRRKHVCVVLEKTDIIKGQLQKIKDYVAYGDIDEETYKELVSKRSKKDEDGKLKPWFELTPPKGGFERKGIKKPYSIGGALGNRGDKINDLIKKMI